MNALRKALTNLGKTPEEVFKSLKAAGIKGKRRSSRDCPIANYLKKELGYDNVVVGKTTGIDVRHQEAWVYKDVSHTPATMGFINSFDGGCYDSLVARSPYDLL